MICRRYISLAHSEFNQRPCCIKRGVVWWLGHVVTHKRNCVTPSIEAFCVSTHVIPATPLVDLTVLTDKKTVSDVIPTYRETKTNRMFLLCYLVSHLYGLNVWHNRTSGVHVEVLDSFQSSYAGIEIMTGMSRRMVYEKETSWLLEKLKLFGFPRTPTVTSVDFYPVANV